MGGLTGVLAGQAPKSGLPSVRANNGDPILIGDNNNEGTDMTALWTSGAFTAFQIVNGYGLGGGKGIYSRGDPGIEAGLSTQNVGGTCIYANATSTQSGNGIGVKALTDTGFGVVGLSEGAVGFGGPVNSQGVVGITESNLTLPGKDAIGVHGVATSGKGVEGQSTHGYGVMGVSNEQGVVGVTENVALAGAGSIGVQGLANTGTGVEGRSFSGKGVYGWSVNNGPGVHGESGSGPGVKGESAGGFGVLGLSDVNLSGSYAQAVVGLTESLPTPGPAPIGVLGAAANGVGVQGTSTSGIGVLGWSFGGAGGKPLAARGWLFQTANLQEWQDVFGNPLSAVDAGGRLGVGTGTPAFNVHVIGTTDPASVTVDGIGIVGPNFQFRRARGTAGSPSAVMSGDGILFLVGKGYGSTGFSPSGRANLSMYAAHNWTDTQQGTFMSFKTTASGTTTQTEKMRITDTGNILPPTDNSGNIGIASQRWALVRAVTMTPGDLVFENGVRATEEADGLALINPDGRKIALFDRQGNLHIKGDLIKDL